MKWSNTNNSGKSHTYNTRYSRFKSSFNGRRFPIYPTQPTECTATQAAKPTEITIKKNKEPVTYTYNRGDGNKFMSSTISWSRASPLDTLKFEQEITREDLRFSQDSSNNLVITINGSTSDRITINNFMSPYRARAYKDSFNQIDVGGYTLSNFEVRRAVDAGEQPKWASELIAKKTTRGNLFTYNLGDGNKSMVGMSPTNDSSSQDKLKFGEGINLDNLHFDRINDNMIITVNNDPSSRLVLRGFLGHSKNYSRSIQQIEIAGYTKSATDLRKDIMSNQQPVWSSFTKIPTPAVESGNNNYVPTEQLTNLASQFPNESGSQCSIKYDLPRRLPASGNYVSSIYNRADIS